MNHLFQKQLALLPPYNQVLRDELLLKRLSQFATAEPDPEPIEPEEDAEPEEHIRRHSTLSEDVTMVSTDASGSGSDQNEGTSGSGTSGGSGSGRNSFMQNNADDKRMSFDRTSSPEEIVMKQEEEKGRPRLASTMSNNGTNELAENVTEPAETVSKEEKQVLKKVAKSRKKSKSRKSLKRKK